jgi:hypothetical protein
MELEATWNRPTANAWASMPIVEILARLHSLPAHGFLDAQRAMWDELIRRKAV